MRRLWGLLGLLLFLGGCAGVFVRIDHDEYARNRMYIIGESFKKLFPHKKKPIRSVYITREYFKNLNFHLSDELYGKPIADAVFVVNEGKRQYLGVVWRTSRNSEERFMYLFGADLKTPVDKLVYRKGNSYYLYNDFQNKGKINALEFKGERTILWEGSRKLWEVRAWEGRFNPKLCLFEDLDGDGNGELVLVTGGIGGLYVVSGVSGKVLWKKSFLGKVTGVTAGDVDGDGMKEVILSVANRVLFFSCHGKMRKRLVIGKDLFNVDSSYFHPPKLKVWGCGNMDDVEGEDVLLTYYTENERKMLGYSFFMGSEPVWEYGLSGTVDKLKILDFNGDGLPEICVIFSGYEVKNGRGVRKSVFSIFTRKRTFLVVSQSDVYTDFAIYDPVGEGVRRVVVFGDKIEIYKER